MGADPPLSDALPRDGWYVVCMSWGSAVWVFGIGLPVLVMWSSRMLLIIGLVSPFIPSAIWSPL